MAEASSGEGIPQFLTKDMLRIENLTTNPKKMKSMTFKIKENEGSGDCLFLSIMNFFNENKSKFQWIPNNVNELRSAVVDCILSKCLNTNQLNFDRVKDNIAFNLRNQIPTLSQYGKDEISDQEIVKARG